MKTLAALISVLVVFSSCDVYVVEPRYDVRDRMVGYYEVSEYSNTYHEYTYYTLNVSKNSSSSREIYLNNFYAANVSVYAYVENDRITIPYQVVKGYEVEGTGTLDGNDLHLRYSVLDLYDHSSYRDFCDTHAWQD